MCVFVCVCVMMVGWIEGYSASLSLSLSLSLINITGGRGAREGAGDTSGARGGAGRREDWQCGQCGTLNFARRDACFTCHASRSENEVPA